MPSRSQTLAIAGFIVGKAALLWALAAVTGASAFAVLFNWDAYWYAGIVDDGYVWPGVVSSPTGPLSNLAFFPLYPTLAKALTLTGLATPHALFVVAWAATLVAALGIYQVGRSLGGPGVGTLLVLAWGLAPRAAVQVMPYSEPLFTALVAWTIWALVLDFRSDVAKHWWLAGVLSGLAGLTRPSALPLIATLWVVWLIRRDWRRFASAVLGSLGFAGYWAYVGWRVGDPFGYLAVQRDWGSALVNPFQNLAIMAGMTGEPLAFTLGPLAILVAYTVLLGWMLWRRDPWPLVLFAGLSLALVWSQHGYLYSKARFLLPVFPLLVPLAQWLATKRRWVQVLAIVPLTAASIALDIALAQSHLAP